MIFESASEDEDDEDDSSPDESTGTFFGEGDLLLLTREDDLDSLRLVFDDRCFNGDRVCSLLFLDDFCLTGERLVDDFLLLRSADDELERFRRFEDLWATGERRLLREDEIGDFFLARLLLERLLERLLECFLLEGRLFSGEESSGLRSRFRRFGDSDERNLFSSRRRFGR